MAYVFRLGDILRISIRRVFRHRRRYLGPALAISLGAAGLIVVMSMSGHVKAEFNEKLDLLGGATIVQVYFEEKPLDVPWTAKQPFFYREVVNALYRLPGVQTVSMAAFKFNPAEVSCGDRKKDFTLVAVDSSFWKLQSFTPVSGTFFDGKAIEDGERVCIIGAEVARLLFDSEEAAGRHLIVENELYEVRGVLDGFRVGEGTRFLFVPLTTALTRINNMTLPVRLFVRCRTWEDVDEVAAAIPKVVGDYLHTDRLRVEVIWDNLKRVKRVAYWLELFANVCVIATLIVGGLGIWNVMMAGVQARTREIGVKKAVGAEDRDILVQFVTESLIVCLGAVVAGILLGGAAMELLGFLLNRHAPLALFLRAMGWSVGFAIALGLGAGIYPAYKASRMEVASALRYE